jgi:hypothetical protein
MVDIMRTVIICAIVIVSAVFLPATSVAVVIGPFSGRVLDSDTNEPLYGASFFSYSMKHVFSIKCIRVAPANDENFELVDLIRMHMEYIERLGNEYPGEDLRRYNFYEMAGGTKCTPGYRPVHREYSDLIHSLHLLTDENGAFGIQAIYKELEPGSFLESSTVIVYHPGYQVFIKKFRNRDAGDVFKTKDSIIRLERIPPNFDHNAHYHQIVGAMSEMGKTPVIPPMSYDDNFMDAAPSLSPLLDDNTDAGGKRMDWNLFIEKSLLRIPFESFCRRFEWENRR